MVPPWGHEQPVWQLRVGEYRVFYDVDEAMLIVTVRAIRHKPTHKTTEEILKSVDADQVSLDECVAVAQEDRVVVLRNGKPIALIVGVEGLDEEQLELGSSDRFWTLISERRREKTLSRAELEEKIREKNRPQARHSSPSE